MRPVGLTFLHVSYHQINAPSIDLIHTVGAQLFDFTSTLSALQREDSQYYESGLISSRHEQPEDRWQSHGDANVDAEDERKGDDDADEAQAVQSRARAETVPGLNEVRGSFWLRHVLGCPLRHRTNACLCSRPCTMQSSLRRWQSLLADASLLCRSSFSSKWCAEMWLTTHRTLGCSLSSKLACKMPWRRKSCLSCWCKCRASFRA